MARFRLALIPVSVCLILLYPLSPLADILTGKVVKVTDGDSITVLDNITEHRIRLQGIDAPERKQAFGNASRKHLATLVAGREVTVKWGKRDRLVPSVYPCIKQAGGSPIIGAGL